jgi:hypothetical protein
MVTIELQVCSVSSSPLIFSAGLGTGKDERFFIVVNLLFLSHGKFMVSNCSIGFIWYLNPRLIAVL